jgi:uncharacterized protein (DUF433 family)
MLPGTTILAGYDGRITVNPEVCFGKPCIRGYRLRVTDVLSMLAAGATHAEVLESYEFLEEADILAALAYAASMTDQAVRPAA